MKTVVNKSVTESDWKEGFLFLGNHLALDFLNTRPSQNDVARELLPDFDSLLRWFQASGLLLPADAANFRRRWRDSAKARRMLQTARELRERLRKAVLAWESGEAIPGAVIALLNHLVAEHPMRTRVVQTAAGLEQQAWFETREPADLFAPLAESAAALFTEIGRDRVRQCAGCVLHFCDTSKKGTRRWCSMRLCGNRAKVAAYAARQRSPVSGEGLQ